MMPHGSATDVPSPPNVNAPDADKPRKSQATLIVDAAKADGVEVFHSPARVGFATAKVDGHTETWPLKSSEFASYLRHRLYKATGKTSSTQAIGEARATLEAFALIEGPERTVHIRIAEHDGAIFLDLGDSTWSAVEVTIRGWRVVDRPPIKFVRKRGMLALPRPVAGGAISELRELLNAEDPGTGP